MSMSLKTNMESHVALLLSDFMTKEMPKMLLKVWMEKILTEENFELILHDMIGHNHLEENIGQDREVVIEDLDHVIVEEDQEAVHVIEDVEVAQDHVTEEEDPDLDLDQEINHVIDQEAAHEEEADLGANQKVEVEAKRLLEKKVVQDQDPNHEADLVQKILEIETEFKYRYIRALLSSLQIPFY